VWHPSGWFVVGAMVGASVVYVWLVVMFADRDDDGWPR
jgi:hypothetical protein